MTNETTAEGRDKARARRQKVTVEPEPIDAEFEAAEQPRAPGVKRAPRQRSRSISFRDLVVASSIAGGTGAILGAVIAIVATNANSGASTGTLAQEIDSIRSAQTQLLSRADQVGGDVVSLRARLDTQTDKMGQRETGEAELRSELAAVNTQINALIGAGGGAVQPTTAGTSPLGVLLSRLNRLESIIANDADAPKTTPEMRRALAELSEKVGQVDQAQKQFTAALNKRQMAFDSLENGIDKLSADVTALNAKVDATAIRSAGGLTAKAGPGVTAEESRAIRAFSALESAARSGGNFLSQQQTLAALLPADPDVASLKELATEGAPTLDDLRKSFAEAALVAERIAAHPQPDGWNWLRRTVAALAPPSPNAEQEAAALIIEARQGLEMGDAHSAVQAVDDLRGGPAAAFAAWRLDAARRADLDQRLEALNARLSGPAQALPQTPAKNSG